MRLYLELEDHPAIKTEKIMNEPTQKNIRKDIQPDEKEKTVKEKDQTKRDKQRAKIGEML